MEIKKLILSKLIKQQKVKVSDIVKATGFSRAYINRFFQELRDEGKIVLLGRANKTRYVFAEKKAVRGEKKKILNFHCILRNKNLSEDVILDEIKKNTGIFLNLHKNTVQILNYSFTEMLNNAIEHSKSKTVEIFMEKEDDMTAIKFEVIDEGVGIFNNIKKKKKLHSELEAIQDLIKGKQTTSPKEHSGEGIFFTSKVGDKLVIQSSKKKLIFDNILNDIFIKDIKNFKGTKIIFTINLKTKRDLNKVFRQYSGKLFEFNKTRAIVKLYKMDADYVSRSQARRILSGLEKFKIIMLDFKDIDTVGQAFTDEVFRVWKNHHPHIIIKYQNTNDNIEFMIKRAKGGLKVFN